MALGSRGQRFVLVLQSHSRTTSCTASFACLAVSESRVILIKTDTYTSVGDLRRELGTTKQASVSGLPELTTLEETAYISRSQTGAAHAASQLCKQTNRAGAANDNIAR